MVPVTISSNKGGVVMRMANFILLQTMVASLVPLLVVGQEIQTSWGDPDLQGIWSNPVVTPLQRLEVYGTREFLTADEIATEETEIFEFSQQLGRDNREGSGTERDVARAYQDHWFGDPSLRRGRRTSMIIDPLDGRIPALTLAAEGSIDARCLDERHLPYQGADHDRDEEEVLVDARTCELPLCTNPLW